MRRIRLELEEPTRDGESVLYLLTNLSRQAASAKAIARLYRQRWTIELAFQQLEGYLRSEINTLGYPQAALFGFCVALVAYNALAVVLAALRAVPRPLGQRAPASAGRVTLDRRSSTTA